MTRFAIAITPASNHIPSSNIRLLPDAHPSADPRKATTISKIIATISCTINTPIDIFPYTLSASWVSFNNFTITIVLEKLIAAAISSAVCRGNHKDRSNTNHNIVHNAICAIHTPRAVFPCSLIVAGFNHNPTKNKSNEIPSSEKSVKKLPSS